MSNKTQDAQVKNADLEEVSANLQAQISTLFKDIPDIIAKGGSDEEGTAVKLQDALAKFEKDAAQNLTSSSENTSTSLLACQPNKEEEYNYLALGLGIVAGVFLVSSLVLLYLYLREHTRRKYDSGGTRTQA